MTEDPDATVDAWVAGGLQFSNGAAYSYVVVVGTGSTREPWARKLHSSQVAAPLLEVLLEDLETDAKSYQTSATKPAVSSSRPRRAQPERTVAEEIKRTLLPN